jgi:hypothetical protein
MLGFFIKKDDNVYKNIVEKYIYADLTWISPWHLKYIHLKDIPYVINEKKYKVGDKM